MKIADEILHRKGARKREEVPADVLSLLNSGQIGTVNLVEWLAADQLAILQAFLSENGWSNQYAVIKEEVDGLKKQTVNTVNEAIGRGLSTIEKSGAAEDLLTKLGKHPSDIVRGWGAYLIAYNEEMTIEEQLKALHPFAGEDHFGVREIAWLALRPNMVVDLTQSIQIMEGWALSEEENIRRFASESLRPRGVWCAHINELKENPDLAINILEPLKSDPSKYVRDSVGNWLNDASKTAPDWVTDVCERWDQESDTKETQYILKKALRTIRKA